MPGYGLMNGLAQGASNFADTFLKVRQQKIDEERNRLMQERLMASDAETARHNRTVEEQTDALKRLQIEANRDARRQGLLTQDPDRALPTEDKHTVSKLADKNASKISIATQIDAVLDRWGTLTESEKLQQGRQLIKVLNSTEGQDAVGAEEAKRLGAKLEFALGNFTNSNPIQFGRDLEGFRRDAEITRDSMGAAINANNEIVGRITGRKQKTGMSPRGGVQSAKGLMKASGGADTSGWSAEDESRMQELLRKQNASK